MKFGQLFFQQTPDPTYPFETRVEEALSLVELCDSTGFDYVWFSENHFSNYGLSPNPVLMATAASQRTTNVRIGLAVVVLPFWDPRRLAEDLSVLDHLSRGRLDIGIGRGYQHIEFDGLGLDYDARQEQFEESLEILLKSWSDDDFQHVGEHFQMTSKVSVLPKPMQRPHPPIWMAVRTPEAIRWVANTDFNVLGSANWVTTSQGQSDHEIYLEARHAAGHADDRWSYTLNRQCFVVDSSDPAVADAEWEKFKRRSLYTQRAARHLRAGDIAYERGHIVPAPFEDEPTDEELRDRSIFGTPEQCIKQLTQQAQAMSVDQFIFQIDFGGLEPEKSRRVTELLGNEIIPAVREAVDNE